MRIQKPRPDSRRGYALMLVLVFLMLLVSLLGLTYQQIAAVLRVESYRSRQTLSDQGCLGAAAQALAQLESGPPPTDPYVFAATVETSLGTRYYTVTIASEGTNLWAVQVSPGVAGF